MKKAFFAVLVFLAFVSSAQADGWGSLPQKNIVLLGQSPEAANMYCAEKYGRSVDRKVEIATCVNTIVTMVEDVDGVIRPKTILDPEFVRQQANQEQYREKGKVASYPARFTVDSHGTAVWVRAGDPGFQPLASIAK